MKLLKVLGISLFIISYSNYSIAQSIFFPLGSGQVSIFKYTDDFNNGNEKLTLKTEVLSNTEQINGKTYSTVQTSYGSEENYTIVSSVYMRTLENGSVANVENKDQTEEQIFINYPLVEGKKWKQTSNNVTSDITIATLNGTIATPNKTYSNCLVLQSNLEDGKTLTYMKEDIGMVAITIVVEEEEKIMIYLLD